MNIGFVGCGKMGGALIQGLLAAGVCPRSHIIAFDAATEPFLEFAAAVGIEPARDNSDVAERADVVVLCVKPNDALATLAAFAAPLSGKLLISIAAGIKIAALQQAAGPSVRVVRVMPNTPALIHRGAAAYSPGHGVTAHDAVVVETIFRAVGTVAKVKEELLDVVTGLSGSGPAYIYTVIEAMADGGVLMGLPRDLALQLAAQTAAGTALMVSQTGQHPAQLRDQVTSPGGTTIAGLEALEKAGIRGALIAAVRAATERSRELGA